MKRSRPEAVPQLRVLLIDPDEIFGRRLAEVLDGSCEFRLCGHVLDEEATQRALANEDPDLVVAVVERIHDASSRLFHRLTRAGHERRILATSRNCDLAQAEQVLLAGVWGLFLKSEPAEEILNAFQTVTRGQVYVSQMLTIPLLKRLLRAPSGLPSAGVESLTDRELQVFESMGLGLSTREVAARLGLSCKTVDSHRAKIQHRLGVESAAALAQRAFARTHLGFRAGHPASDDNAAGEHSDFGRGTTAFP